MKKHILKISVALVVSLLSAFVFTIGITAQHMQEKFDNEIYGNMVRLHILANSDSEFDQSAKFAIRDEIVEYISGIVSSAENAEEASEIILSNIDEINSFAELASARLGYDYDISTDFGEEYYPVRYYDGFSFPSGVYKSLIIKLGSGNGKNWWCVLYPTVCGSVATSVPEKLSEAGMSDETIDIVCDTDGKYDVEFFILEMLGKLKK